MTYKAFYDGSGGHTRVPVPDMAADSESGGLVYVLGQVRPNKNNSFEKIWEFSSRVQYWKYKHVYQKNHCPSLDCGATKDHCPWTASSSSVLLDGGYGDCWTIRLPS